MPVFPLRLPTESTIGRSGEEAYARLVNGYVEVLGSDQDGKAKFCVYARPGLTRFSVNSASSTARVLVQLSDSALIAVLGNQVTQFATTGTSSVLTTLTGTDSITAALNENSTHAQIAMVSDGGTYSLLSNGSITNPTTGFSAPNSVTFLKGKFLFTTAGGLIFHSALNDGTSFNSLSFGYANSDPAPLVRGVADAGYYYVFGERIMEIWQDAGTVPFALAPLQQYIPMGLLSKYSLAKGAANGLLWVDHRGIVRYGRDGGARRISTHTVERAISELSTADQAALSGSYFVSQGHEFYALSAPTQWTWVCEIAMERWFEWDSYGLGRWLGGTAIPFAGGWVIPDYRNGLLYKVNADEYDDAGNEFVMELYCPHVHGYPNSIIADQLNIDGASGVGLLSGTADDIAPQVQVSFSQDGGKTFHGERYASIGASGQYGQLVRMNNWGRINPKGRVWRIAASARVLRSVIQASITGQPLDC